MITRFGSENVTKTLVFQVINMGTVGGQRVLDNDRLQVRMFLAKIVHQPLCCIAFAVVFVSAVFFQDRFGGQRQNLFVLGVDYRRPEHLVVVCRLSVRVVLDATALAPDLVRRVAACAVDSNQVMSFEHGPVLKNISALQEGKNNVTAQLPFLVNLNSGEFYSFPS